ncbi:MAG: hypothetical protein R3A10_06065 [Caldilineaceae bacterium]
MVALLTLLAAMALYCAALCPGRGYGTRRLTWRDRVTPVRRQLHLMCALRSGWRWPRRA